MQLETRASEPCGQFDSGAALHLPFPTLVLESVTTFNMMDSALATDVRCALDGISIYLRQAPRIDSWGMLLAGAGPHFCAGGNTQAPRSAHQSPYADSAYSMYQVFLLVTGLDMACANFPHGSVVGGGVAYALQTTNRVAASNTSFAFGNLSRANVPGILLSHTLA